MSPLVSIVIPVYNCEAYIAYAIESALNQTYKKIEIIVVDDGSTDLSFKIAEKYESNVVSVIKQAKRGASAARNLGIERATGDYIQFLDADDLIHPKKIEFQIETLKHFSGPYLVGGTWQRFDKDVKKPYKKMPYDDEETRVYESIEWLINRPYMAHHAWLVPRELIELAGLWDEELTFNDDGEFFYRIIAASKGVIIDHKAAVYYRSGIASSMSQRRDRRSMLSWLKSIQSYKKVANHVAGDRAKEAIDKSFFELSYSCLNKFPDIVEVCKHEMYNPDKIYNIGDNTVYFLSKIVGLSNAKNIRLAIKSVRELKVVNFIVVQIKLMLGWPSY